MGDVVAAWLVGKMFGLSLTAVCSAIQQLHPVEHRLQPIRNPNGLVIIDDSYNGNSAGAAEAIKLLSKFTRRRKIYLTPGLVEAGSQAANVHVAIGRQLATVADVVILIKNSVTGFIEEGIIPARSSDSSGHTTPSRQVGTPLLSQEGNAPQDGSVAPQAIGAKLRSSPPIIGGVPPTGGGIPEILWFKTALEAHAALGKILQPSDVIVFQNDWGDQYV